MKANELRIGNCLLSPIDNRILYVSAIFNTHFRCRDKDGIDFGESLTFNYKPIPITSEILLACGFTKGRYDSYFIILSNKFSKLTYYSDAKFVELNNIKITKWGHVYCDYVHQLQNLYFALTNQELKFKTELK